MTFFICAKEIYLNLLDGWKLLKLSQAPVACRFFICNCQHKLYDARGPEVQSRFRKQTPFHCSGWISHVFRAFSDFGSTVRGRPAPGLILGGGRAPFQRRALGSSEARQLRLSALKINLADDNLRSCFSANLKKLDCFQKLRDMSSGHRPNLVKIKWICDLKFDFAF